MDILFFNGDTLMNIRQLALSIMLPVAFAGTIQAADQTKMKATVICEFFDFDGVMAADESVVRQFRNAFNAFTTKRKIALALWQVKYRLTRALAQRATYGEMYDENNNELKGNSAHLRFFGRCSPVIDEHHDELIKALAQAKPMDATVDIALQSQDNGKLVIILTNNDAPSYKAKMTYLNDGRRARGLREFNPDGYFVVGSNEAENASPLGKPHRAFYKKAMKYAEKLLAQKGLDLDSMHYVFIDDRQKYLDAFAAYAQERNIRLTTLIRPADDQLFQEKYAQMCKNIVAETPEGAQQPFTTV
jgi:hypothetical protein